MRDYGTHYQSSVDAGRIFAQVDHIHHSSNKGDNSFISKVTALASTDFFRMVSPKAGIKHKTTKKDGVSFRSNRTYSQIQTYGRLTVADWSCELPNAIDRTGNPLHFVITLQTLPELPPLTVMGVTTTEHKAINCYYEINPRLGCTIPGSTNFDFQAYNDNSCSSAETNCSFGGIYQTCEIDQSFNGIDDLCHSTDRQVMQLNPLTGNTNCPTGYTAIELNSRKVKLARSEYKCKPILIKCDYFG